MSTSLEISCEIMIILWLVVPTHGTKQTVRWPTVTQGGKLIQFRFYASPCCSSDLEYQEQNVQKIQL
jgi:hypothetical protein